MEFLRKHYEKILLSVVLLGMAVAAAFLPLKVSQVREDLAQTTRNYDQRKIDPIPELDLSTNLAVLTRVRNPAKIALASAGHNIFNPVEWKKKPDGTPIPGESIGVGALAVTNISPLYLKIDFRGGHDSGGEIRYDFMITREAATNASLRSPQPRSIPMGGKTEVFTLREAKGPKEAPTEVVVDLTESRQAVTVAKGKPYAETAGYAADFKYELENKSIPPRQRVGQKLTLGGGTYNIIEITATNVTLEDSRTKKRSAVAIKTGR
jgi:hypothetical protein